MSALASVLLGVSVTVLTTALWPRKAARDEYRFVEEKRVPRTLH